MASKSLGSFLENLGKFFFAKMRPVFFFILLSAPLLAAGAFLFFQSSRIQEAEERLTAVSKNIKSAFERKLKKERFIRHYSNPDPYFIDKKIESLVFLQNEKTQIETLLRHPAVLHKEILEDRYNYLTGKENRIEFAEENIQISGRMKETEEKQRHPVQMDQEDLQKLLAYIEDTPVGPFSPACGTPQLVIREFHLKKIKTPLKSEIFEIEMDLFKREFNSK